MLERLQRLLRSWVGAVVDQVGGSTPTPDAPAAREQDRPARPDGPGRGESAAAPPAVEDPTPGDLDRQYEALESRRLLEEIRRGGDPAGASPTASPPPSAAPAPAGRVEKTIGPASDPARPPATAPPRVEKTIGPASPAPKREDSTPEAS